MLRQIFYLALLILSASTSQCTKTSSTPDDPNVLPPETQTGAGTYACKINGAVWRYSDPSFNFSQSKTKTRLEFFPLTNGGTISLSGIRYDGNDNSIDLLGFSASYVNVNKDEKLNTDKKAFSLAYTNHRATTNECYEFVTTYPNDTTYQANLFQEGKMSISKLDNVNRIISGTFSCSIIHAGCDTLKITEGRFDFKF